MHIKNLSAKHRDEALRAIRTRKFEFTASGIEIPSMGLGFAGGFEISGNDGIWDVVPNTVVQQGRNHILDAALSQGTQSLAFYIAPFGTNVAVADGWTGATWAALAGEVTNYTETNRQAWVEPGPAAGAISNAASPAVFTFGPGGATVRGLALVTEPAKSSTAGLLIAAARLATDKVMAEGEELRARYTLTANAV